MKIGIVLPSNPAYSETFFRNKIEGLQEKGIEVIVFVKTLTLKGEYICPIKVHPNFHSNSGLRLLQSLSILLKLLLTAPRPTLRIIKIARENGFSLLKSVKAAAIAARILPEKLDWLHFGYATAALEREFIGQAIGAKVAVSFRGYDINQLPLSMKEPYTLLWKNVHKVHSISNYLFEKAVGLGLAANTSHAIITPAVQINRFKPNTGLRKGNRVLFVSRLHWIKGIEYALQAIAGVHQDLKTTVVGSGEDTERLLFTAHQLGISKKTNFVGKKNVQEVVDLYKEHDLFIQFSHQEGFCNAVLEAQSAGLLCIVSDADGLSENVLHGETGWVVPKRDVKALTETIEMVLNLPEEQKQKVRRTAMERVKNKFSLEKQRKEFVDFYTA
jgi:colanic acid/amylovoran biosynthesis glycosyltransferase